MNMHRIKTCWSPGPVWPRRCALLSLALLAACAAPKAPPAPPPAPVVVVPAPVVEPTPPVPDTPPQAPAAPALSTPQEVQRAVMAAIEFLQGGQEEQAVAELRRVLVADPNNRSAQSLMRQMKDDPVAALGRESFAYRVLPGESLSRIAQRFLNDLQQFYILARYNNIKVPRTLAEGQIIRVPGKAPPAQAVASAPAPAAGTEPATEPSPPAIPATSSLTPERQRAETIARHTRDARAAFAKQDLDTAIKSWDAVLKLDPENRTAFLEREKVVGLKEKLGKLK